MPEAPRSLRFSQDAPLEAGTDGRDAKSLGPWKPLPMNHKPLLLKTHFFPVTLDCAHAALKSLNQNFLKTTTWIQRSKLWNACLAVWPWTSNLASLGSCWLQRCKVQRTKNLLRKISSHWHQRISLSFSTFLAVSWDVGGLHLG